MLISTGITLQELCALNTKDIQKDRFGNYCLIAARNNRFIPLNYETLKAISRWLALRSLLFHGKDIRPLFVIGIKGQLMGLGLQARPIAADFLEGALADVGADLFGDARPGGEGTKPSPGRAKPLSHSDDPGIVHSAQ